MHVTDNLGPVSFPSSYGEYAAVRIGVICNYAPDDELDDNDNPTLHFQRLQCHNEESVHNDANHDVSRRIPCRNPESGWTITKGKDHLMVFPVAPPRPCCAHTRQSKIVHSRICNNLLSSLFICSNADSSVFCHCDGCVHVDGSHIRLVGNHIISSSFAVPTSLCENHNRICSLQV